MQNYPAIITAAFFNKNGAPATGLIPDICIYQVTSTVGSPQGDSLVVTPTPMIEVGKGFYKYIFTGYNSEVKYAYQIDGEAGGGNLGNGRYAVGTNENFAEDIAHEVWEEPKNLHLTGSPETMGSILNQIFNATVGSPSGSGNNFTLNQIIAGVWGETLLGSPQPYPPGSAGNLLAYNNQLLLEILETSDDLGGSPQINLATTVWNTIVTGSPQPFPPGSAGNTLFLTNETVNDINVAMDDLVTCLFGSPKTNPGSPFIPLTVENIVSNVWSELLAGSPAPYPTGSAGGLINQIATSSGLTPAQVTAAVWDVPAANYPSTGSPQTMGTQLSLTTANTVEILDFTELLLAAQYNRTFLDKAAFTLTIYASDGTTPIRVFSLRDGAGVPSITEIVDRVPISGSPLIP